MISLEVLHNNWSHESRQLVLGKNIVFIGHDRYLTYVALMFTMSDNNEGNENIESAQKNQKKVGAAEDNPETTGPAENLREEAAEMVDEDEDSSEPA